MLHDISGYILSEADTNNQVLVVLTEEKIKRKYDCSLVGLFAIVGFV